MHEKKRRDRLIRGAESQPAMALGFQDEVWWSRQQQPSMHAWTDADPLRLVAQSVPAPDPTGKAIAGYGCYLPAGNDRRLRFVAGRPVSTVTCVFLGWLLAHLANQGNRALVMIWD